MLHPSYSPLYIHPNNNNNNNSVGTNHKAAHYVVFSSLSSLPPSETPIFYTSPTALTSSTYIRLLADKTSFIQIQNNNKKQNTFYKFLMVNLN
jgi:hypothetical protein